MRLKICKSQLTLLPLCVGVGVAIGEVAIGIESIVVSFFYSYTAHFFLLPKEVDLMQTSIPEIGLNILILFTFNFPAYMSGMHACCVKGFSDHSTSALNSIRPRAYANCDIKQSPRDTR